MHKKGKHIENVAACWNFTVGNCDFRDDFCWFSHSKQLKTSEKTELSKCHICGQVFKTLNALQQHKKREHVLTVPPCRNSMKGSCWYGADKCWFRHADTEMCNEPNVSNKNQEITEKIFKMMETFTQRIMQLENQMEKTIHKTSDAT